VTNRKTLNAALLAALVGAGAFLLAPADASAGHGCKGKHGKHHGFGKAVESLDLDDATRAKVDAAIEASRERSEEIRTELKSAHEAMRTLLEAEAPNADAVMTQADAIGALKTEMKKERLATMLEIRTLLTPEQRAGLKAFHAERRGKRGHHGKGHCGERCDGACKGKE